MRRRDALILGGALAMAVAFSSYLRNRGPAFEFRALAGHPEFRVLLAGDTTRPGFDPFLGLNESTAEKTTPVGDLCLALFGPDGWKADPLPLVVFTDYYCPICAVLDRVLIELADNSPNVRLVWHELPILGPRSRRAAQVALAAGRQGAYLPVHRDLMQRGLRPGPNAISALAERHGLDAGQLMADADSPRTAQQLARSAGLAGALGIVGTPGMMVGRTLVSGALTRPSLDRLIALERSEPFPGCA